jgi:hypothetical protein
MPKPILITQYIPYILPSIMHSQLGMANMMKKASFRSKKPGPFW